MTRKRIRRHRSVFRPHLERLEARLALAAVANAGLDQDVDRGSTVALSGVASTGSGGLSYLWTQRSGPDVTDGAGTLAGASPQFNAPARVVTLEFDLVITDADGTSSPDRIVVAVLEDHDDAMFVSPLGSDTNAGTRAAPLLSIQAAITIAASQGDDVYVAAGTYPESLSLATGVSVYGGFNGSSWLRDPTLYVTTISGGSTAVVGANVQSVVLDGLTIVSADAATAEGSSIAMALSGASNVELSGNIIRAGNGGNGTGGNNGTPHGSTSAANGNNGQPGSADGSGPRLGGAQTAGPEFGGKGGNGGPAGSTNGQGGSPGSPGLGGAAGGAGGTGSSDEGFSCGFGEDGINGNPGANGAQGMSGAGGASFGNIVGVQYASAGGNNGMAGTNGRGGGGGGGGGGQGGIACVDGAGNGGGSGGQGGLGGDFGRGGTGGGASIALLLVNASGISIHDNMISSANGGNGGNGGSGAAAQQGGAGGIGATIGTDEVGAGGNGGRGGNGGGGGHGGGGGGGPSIGIFSSNSSGTSANHTIATGTAGTGGSSSGVAGANGNVHLVFGSGFTLSPSNVLSLSTSTITENQPPGAPAGDLSTMNSTAGAPYTYALIAGIGDDNNPSFAISGDQLVTGRPLDFEARSALSVRVRSTDSGGASIEKVLTLSVTNNNDAPSCTIGPQQDTTDESTPQSIPDWLKNCSAGDSGQTVGFSVTTDKPELFTSPPAVDEKGILTYDPAPNVRGIAKVTVTVQDNGGTANGGVDSSETMIIFNIAKPRPWRNAAKNLDVTGDGPIVAEDALENINFLNAFGSLELPPRDTISKPYYDVNGDGFIAANDALDIINFLNAGFGGEGEGRILSSESNTADQNLANAFDEIFALLAADDANSTPRRRPKL